eukprot:130569_1
MFKLCEFVGSKELLIALNDGKFARALDEMKKIKLNIKWKLNNKSFKLPFQTVGGRKPTRKQIAMAKLFDLISYVVYPYWAYNIKRKKSGSLIIEVSKLEKLSSVMNVHTTKLLNKPNNINVAFLDTKRLKIFLQKLGKNESTLNSMLQSSNSVDPKIKMHIIFVMGGPTFCMTSNKNNLNKSFNSEANNFKCILQTSGVKNCDFLEIAIKTRKIWVHALNIIISDPDWMECMKKPNTNYPTFEIFHALNNNEFPKECHFDGTLISSQIKWKNASQKAISKVISNLPKNTKRRHYRMTLLYVQIRYLLFSFWAYKTKHTGAGLIVVRGQRMFNSLDNFVNYKGELIENTKKLNATFLNIEQLKAYLSHFDLDPTKAGKPELGTAKFSYENKTKGIGVLFGFQNVMPYVLFGTPSKQNKDYDSESILFENMMRTLNMKSCEYLEIDFNKKHMIGFSMIAIHDGIGFTVSKDIKKNIDNVRTCGYCKASAASMRCSRCNNMWYCSVKCQKPDWKLHKKNCVPIKKK